MGIQRLILSAALLGIALAPAAATAQNAAPKKASTAECASLLDPFHNKQNSAVKDDTIKEYAPLMKAYWSKGCSASFYEEQVTPELRQRVEAVVPRPKAAAKKS
jgi:hypothetical protein